MPFWAPSKGRSAEAPDRYPFAPPGSSESAFRSAVCGLPQGCSTLAPVNFERVLRALLAAFGRKKIRHAVIGGFALGVLGYARATMDLDFLVHRDDLDKLHAALTALGYKRLLRTENVSHYQHRDSRWGGLDFIHAFRETSLGMLARAKSYKIFGGKQTLRFADPEDVIGLKVQAMVNDPIRKSQEVADIEMLMRLHGEKLNWERIQKYYGIFDLKAEARRLRKRFGHD